MLKMNLDGHGDDDDDDGDDDDDDDDNVADVALRGTATGGTATGGQLDKAHELGQSSSGSRPNSSKPLGGISPWGDIPQGGYPPGGISPRGDIRCRDTSMARRGRLPPFVSSR